MIHKLRFFCSNKSECRFRAEQNHSLIIGKLLYFLQEWVCKIHRDIFHHLRSQNIPVKLLEHQDKDGEIQTLDGAVQKDQQAQGMAPMKGPKKGMTLVTPMMVASRAG